MRYGAAAVRLPDAAGNAAVTLVSRFTVSVIARYALLDRLAEGAAPHPGPVRAARIPPTWVEIMANQGNNAPIR